MIRYFCDICKEEITHTMQYNFEIIYETKTRHLNRKLVNKRSFCLCEQCNDKMPKQVKEFVFTNFTK